MQQRVHLYMASICCVAASQNAIISSNQDTGSATSKAKGRSDADTADACSWVWTWSWTRGALLLALWLFECEFCLAWELAWIMYFGPTRAWYNNAIDIFILGNQSVVPSNEPQNIISNICQGDDSEMKPMQQAPYTHNTVSVMDYCRRTHHRKALPFNASVSSIHARICRVSYWQLITQCDWWTYSQLSCVHIPLRDESQSPNDRMLQRVHYHKAGGHVWGFFRSGKRKRMQHKECPLNCNAWQPATSALSSSFSHTVSPKPRLHASNQSRDKGWSKALVASHKLQSSLIRNRTDHRPCSM
jgi:hypothetical protein